MSQNKLNQNQKKTLSPKKGLVVTSEEQLKKIEALKSKTTGSTKVDDYWILLAEFGMKFGWEAYKDARDDEISLEEMMTLVEASRRIDNLNQYLNIQASFLGSAAAKSKRPSNVFKQMTSKLLRKSKSDV